MRIAHSQAARHGFTLIELLVVIAVVAIILAIALPVVSQSIKKSREMTSLSNARQIVQDIERYAQGEGNYPFGTAGPSKPPHMFGPGQPTVIQVWSHWSTKIYWIYLLHDYADWGETYQIWLSPGTERERFSSFQELLGANSSLTASSAVLPSYHYSNSFIGDPKVWNPETKELSESIGLRPTRPHAVAFPSAKAIIFDAEVSYLNRPPTPDDRRAVAMADGSASARRTKDAREPVQNFHKQGDPQPLHDTSMGIMGNDY